MNTIMLFDWTLDFNDWLGIIQAWGMASDDLKWNHYVLEPNIITRVPINTTIAPTISAIVGVILSIFHNQKIATII